MTTKKIKFLFEILAFLRYNSEYFQEIKDRFKCFGRHILDTYKYSLELVNYDLVSFVVKGKIKMVYMYHIHSKTLSN